jgi:hypothetical protein
MNPTPFLTWSSRIANLGLTLEYSLIARRIKEFLPKRITAFPIKSWRMWGSLRLSLVS